MREHVPAAECRFRGSQSPTTERLRGNTQTISQKAKKVASGSRTLSQQRQAGRQGAVPSLTGSCTFYNSRVWLLELKLVLSHLEIEYLRLVKYLEYSKECYPPLITLERLSCNLRKVMKCVLKQKTI